MNVTTLNMTTLDGNVIIKKGEGGTPTPPSGGGSSSWRYFDTTKATVTEGNLAVIAKLFSLFKNKYEDNTTTILYELPTLELWENIVVAMATDFNQKISFPSLTGIGVLKTIEEVFNDMGGVESFKEAFNLTEITKEEFYNLD